MLYSSAVNDKHALRYKAVPYVQTSEKYTHYPPNDCPFSAASICWVVNPLGLLVLVLSYGFAVKLTCYERVIYITLDKS